MSDANVELKLKLSDDGATAGLAKAGQSDVIQDVVKTSLEQWGQTGSRELDTSHANIADTAAYKLNQASQDAQTAQKAALDGLTPTIGKASAEFADLASKFPALTGTVVLGTTALTAFAGTVGLATIALRRAGATGGIPGDVPTSASKGGRVGNIGRTAGIAGAVAAPVAYLGGAALEKGFGAESAITRYGKSSLNGAAAGAMFGSVVPGIGTAAGAAIGGVGGFLTELLTDAFADAAPQPAKAEINVNVRADPSLQVSQSVNADNAIVKTTNTGSIVSGAPG